MRTSALTVFAQLAVREAEESGALLLVPAAVGGVQLVDAGGDGLLGAAGLVEVAVHLLPSFRLGCSSDCEKGDCGFSFKER